MNKPTTFQHGEIMLKQVDSIPKGGKTTTEKTFILAHSETGHHHVLESTKEFKVTQIDKDRLYMELFEPAKLVHKKTFDFHPTLNIKKGIYKLFHKTEYDLFGKVIRDVKD